MNPERMYQVILGPHVSEKSTLMSEDNNQYAFKVAVDASKPEIKEAVETLFKVDVRKVTTANVKGKVKRNMRGLSRKKNWKKAYITVAEGQELDYMMAD